MDPKMDSGYLAEGEALEDDYDVLGNLLPEEVIGIMDQMLCYEVRPWKSHAQAGTVLILMLGIVDGMAYGIPTFTVIVHVSLY